jgi:excisionase family DNA binding protein
LEEYLTIAEVAERLKLKPKTVKNKMAAGLFRQGVHYIRPLGMHARFKWSAVEAWLEQTDDSAMQHDYDGIPMARGYVVR